MQTSSGMNEAPLLAADSPGPVGEGSNAPKPVFGVIGLGSMGMGAALSAIRGGFETWGCDPRPDIRDKFAGAGGHSAPTPAALGAHCNIVQVLVVNAAQTEDVLFGTDGLAAALRPGAVVITSATVDPALPPIWAGKLEALGIHMIDGPVSGGAAKAASGEMTVMASGKAEALALAGPVLAAIAGKVYHLGEKAGVGSTVKMVNQHLAGVHIAAACEAMALGLKAGADAQQLYDVICNSAGMSWMFQNRIPHVLAGDYAPLSAVNIFVKDLGIVLDAARKMQFPLPMAASAHQLYLATAAMGHGAEDDAAVIKYYAALAGLTLPKAAAGDG